MNKVISSITCVNYFFVDSMNVNQYSGAFLSIGVDRDVYSCGRSVSGLHGHPDEYVFPPRKISELKDIKIICCGSNHTSCLDYNGSCFSFGCNGEGQLGIGKTKDELEFTHIPQRIILPLCKDISCGYNCTICLTEDGILYSMGDNRYNQLGVGDNISYNYPKKIPYLSNIKHIECGIHHAMCITNDNTFYIWGNNYRGQLGQGNNVSSNKPIQCLNWPDNIIDIKSGTAHTLLLTSEGQVYSFGDNRFGQLGLNKIEESINLPTLIGGIPEIQRIDCGYYHSMCIDINNNLWLFGINKIGQLGLEDKGNRYKPIKHPTLSNIIDISSGGDHTFVKTFNNKIYAFGNNKCCEIGIKTSEEYQLTPIQVLKGKEDIWYSINHKSKQKSARK